MMKLAHAVFRAVCLTLARDGHQCLARPVNQEVFAIQSAQLTLPSQILDSADSDSWTATLQWHSQAKAEASDLVRIRKLHHTS
jgi:hypothetical protein